jgi:hypothetical protein
MKIKKINVYKNSTETTRASGGNGGSYSSFSSSQGESTNVDLSQYALKNEVKFTQGDGFNSVIEKDHFLQANNDYETAVGKYNQSVADETIFTVGNGTDENERKNAFAVTTSGDATVANRMTANSVSASTINSDTANLTNISSSEITNNGSIKSQSFSGESGTIQTLNTDNIVNTDTIKTKNLEVTGSSHFFELIIDKIKSAGGSMMLTPADGFEVEKIKSMANNITLYWRCQDGNGKQRDNMWKVNDQALCMSFNQAKVGTTHNVNNKYYWCLVTDVSDNNNPIEIDGELYNYIRISRFDSVGVVEPEIGDSIVMCGYRGTDDIARQSAIYMSAYSSLDKGITAPVFAQYQGINDFDLESHRKSYYDANSAKFIGEFEALDGENIFDIINNKIAESEASIKLDTKNIVLSVSEKTQERRNLLVGSDFKKQNNNFFISDKARIEINSGYKGTNCIKVIDDTDGNYHYIGVYWDGSQGGRSIKIEKGKKYTVSCYYKATDINARLNLDAIYTDKETNAKRLGWANNITPNNFKLEKVNEWQLCAMVIDTTDAKSDYIAFNFWETCMNESGRVEAYICRPMVEEGAEYNGWTLSKEDYDYIGANLLDNSRTFDVGGNITLVKGIKKLVGDAYKLTTSLSGDDNTFYIIDKKAFKTKTDYTMSFEIVTGNPDYLGVYAYYPASTTKHDFYSENQNSLMTTHNLKINEVNHCVLLEEQNLSYSHKVWIHFNFKGRLPSYIYLNFPKNHNPSAYTYSRTVVITKPKIEEGANVTEWVEKKTDVANAITTINNNVATLTQKANSIESKVTSNTTTINNLSGSVTSLQSDVSDVKQTASSITSTVSSMKDEIIGENRMLGLNGQGWSNNTIYDDSGNLFHCDSTDWFQSHPIMDFSGDYTFSFGFWGGTAQIKILDFTQTYYDDGIYNQYVDFGLYTPCKILTTSSSVSNDTLTNYATSGTLSTWTYTNTETITLAVGDNVAVRVTNSTNNRYNSIYGTVSAINTSSKSVTVKAIKLLDQPNTICTLSCPTDKKDGTDINSLHYDEKLGRYWIRFKESRGSAKTFVILFRNLSASNVGWFSRLMLEEGVEYPHKYNATGQASQSMIKQTANEILMNVNDTYVKIGDGNITLNGDTKVNGSLTLNDEKQGFLLLGDSGTTEISPKSIGTYNDFASKTTNVIKTHYDSTIYGNQSVDGNFYGFTWNVSQKLGTFKKGTYIKILNYTNSVYAIGATAHIGTPSATFYIYENGTLTKTINVGNKTSVDIDKYTVVGDNVEVRVSGRFTIDVAASSWSMLSSREAYNPTLNPKAAINVAVNWENEVPTSSAFMLIGYDGFAVNFGTNTTVYCGKDGFIANYGNSLFKITTDGIVERRNKASIKVIAGSTSSSNPYIYEVPDTVDTILCKTGNTIIKLPSNPYQGQKVKIHDKSQNGETWINFQGYMVRANNHYNTRTRQTKFQCDGQYVRIYTFIDDTWFEEFTG